MRTLLPRRVLVSSIAVLLAAPLLGRADLNWDTTPGNAAIDGGTGNWNSLTDANWTTDGNANVLWDSTGAIFGAVPGIVTINAGNVNATGLTFNVGGYSVAGVLATDTLSLTGLTPTVTVTNGADTATISAIIAAGAVTKAGAGTLVLSGANTYSGVTTINAGTLSISAADNLGDASATNTVSINNNATLRTTANVDLGATRSVTIGTGGATVSAQSGTTATISGAISGMDSFTTTGGGVVVLAADNSGFSGNVNVNSLGGTTNSTLRLSNSNALTSGTVTLSPGTVTGGTGAVLEVNNATIGSAVSLSLNATLAGNFRSALISGTTGTSVWNGAVTLNGDGLNQFYAGLSGTSNFTINGNVSVGGGGFTGTLAVRGTGTGTVNGTINAPNASVNKTDSSTWTLAGAGNSFANLNVQVGTLIVGSASAIPTTVNLTMGQNDGNSPTLNLNGFNVQVANLALISTGGTKTITNSGAGTPTFTVNNAADNTYNGVIAGTLNLTKTSNGRLTLGGANTFTGAIAVNAGALSVTTDGNLGAVTNTITVDNATLRATPTANLALNVGRQIIIGAGGATFDVATNFNFGTGVAADRITGSAPITKNGIGNFRMQGANTTLSSNWTINAGTVEASAAGAFGSGTVTINLPARVALQNGPHTNNVFLVGGSIGSVNADNVLNGALDVVGTGTTYLNDFFQDINRSFTLGGVVTMDAGETLTVGVSRIGSTNSTALLLRNEANVINGTILVNRGLRVETSANDLSGKTTSNAAFTLTGGGLYLKDNNDAISNAVLAYGNNVTILDAAGNGQSQLFANDGSTNVSELDVNRVDATVVTGNTFQLGSLTMGAQTLRVRGSNGYAAEFTGTTTLTGNARFETTTANLTLSGAVNGAVALTKSGAGTLALGGAGGAAPGLTSLTVNTGGTFQLNNTVADLGNRLADSAPITLNTGSLALRGNDGSGSSETVGAVAYGTGAGLSAASASGLVNTTLTLASLTRSNPTISTLTLSSSGTNTLGGTDKVVVTAGGPALDAAGIVGGWGVNATDLAFLTYGANGFVSAPYNETDLSLSTATSLVDRSAAQALGGPATAHAVRLGAGALTGSSLNIGSGGLILNNGAAGVTHSSNLSFSPDGGTTRGPAYLFVQNNDGSGTVQGTLTTVLTGLLSASEIVKNGPGNLRLNNNAQSTNAGLVGAQITINGGSIEIGDRGTANAGRVLPDGVSVVLNQGSINFFENQTLAGLQGFGGTIVRAGGSVGGNTARTLTVNNNVDNLFAGTFTSDDNNVGDSGLTKGGIGKLTFTGTVQNGRTTTINMGEWVLTGTAQMNGVVTDRQRLILNQGGAVTLDNTLSNINDRIALNAGTATGGGYLQLNGGTFTLIGNANVNTTETIGTATALVALNEPFFGAGSDVINVVPGTGRGGILVAERNIVRNVGATVLFKGSNFGGARGTANTATFNYNTSGPALVGGGGAVNTITRGVVAGQFVDSIIGGVDTYGIATLTGTGVATDGVRRLAAAEQVTTFASGSVALNNALLSSALTGIDAATTINSLHLAANDDLAGTGSLTVNSGTILAANNGAAGTNSISVATLAFGLVEATLYTASDLSISSLITGTSGLTKGGAGKLTLSGPNTFDSTTAPANANGNAAVSGVTVNGGLLSISSDGNLGAAANTLRLNNGGGLQTTATLATARGVVLGNMGGVIDAANAGTTTTISGAISGNLGAINSIGVAAGTGTVASQTTVLTKTGAGTLLLTGANTYTGLTQVNAGSLLVGDGVSGSLPANSHVAVNNGGTLGGSGSIGGGATVNTGGTLAPGNSPGLLTLGSLAIGSGAHLALELNSTTPATGYDQVSVNASGSVSLSGGDIQLTLGIDPQDNVDVFYVILNNGASSVSGTFAGLPEGATFAQGGQVFQITYAANWTGTQAGSFPAGGNDVALLAIPEPGAALIFLAGLGVLGLRRHRAKHLPN